MLVDLYWEIQDSRRVLFYKAYHCLKEAFPDLDLNARSPDTLDSTLWTSLGYKGVFHLDAAEKLTAADEDKLKLLCGPHGLTLFKIMLVQKGLSL